MFEPQEIRSEHKDVIHDVSYDYYGQRIATCSSDQTVKVYNIYIYIYFKFNTGNHWMNKQFLQKIGSKNLIKLYFCFYESSLILVLLICTKIVTKTTFSINLIQINESHKFVQKIRFFILNLVFRSKFIYFLVKKYCFIFLYTYHRQ